VGGRDGCFELVLLQRESRSLSKFAKYAKEYDKITENKKPLEVEKLVSKFCIFYIFSLISFFNFLVLENSKV
jgi:hypothetical protein